MFDAPELMRMAQELARHAGSRQSVIARNIANADTPGYRARDIQNFADTFHQSQTATSLRTTRQGHQIGDQPDQIYSTIDIAGSPSPNGNTVSLEEEMVRATKAQSDHTLALTVYSSSLDILRTSLGRGR